MLHGKLQNGESCNIGPLFQNPALHSFVTAKNIICFRFQKCKPILVKFQTVCSLTLDNMQKAGPGQAGQGPLCFVEGLDNQMRWQMRRPISRVPMAFSPAWQCRRYGSPRQGQRLPPALRPGPRRPGGRSNGASWPRREWWRWGWPCPAQQCRGQSRGWLVKAGGGVADGGGGSRPIEPVIMLAHRRGCRRTCSR